MTHVAYDLRHLLGMLSLQLHLRPGTYDILSLAYKDDAESFLRPIISISEEEVYENAYGQKKNFRYLNNIGIQGTPNAGKLYTFIDPRA